MKFLEKMIYTKVLIMVMALWAVPMIRGHGADAPMIGDVAESPNGGGTKGLDIAWYDARATFYGDIHGGSTQDGVCGYDDPNKQGYGVATAALSIALFNDGYTCGACYEIKCAGDPKSCLPGSVKITATNHCPPNYTKSVSISCNPPKRHFELSQPMFFKIAKNKAKNVPVRYRRVLCAKTGGVKFETKKILGSPSYITILPYNIGGTGDIAVVQIRGSSSRWIMMTKIWGQYWSTRVVLTGQNLSFWMMTSDGISKEFINVIPSDWEWGQTFVGKINF